MRIAVLGSTGMIGRHTVLEARHRGHQVIAVSRFSAQRDMHRDAVLECRRANLESADSLRSAFSGADAVIHCAGYYPNLPKPLREEVETAQKLSHNFYDACAGLQLRKIVYVGAAIAIPRAEDGRLSDGELSYPGAPPDRNAYVQVKCLQDRIAQQKAREGMPVVIGVPSMTFGEFDPGKSTGRFVLEMANRGMPGYVAGKRNVVYAGDAARGLVRAVEDGIPGKRYLFTGHNITTSDLMTTIANVTGSAKPKEIPLSVARILAAWQSFRYRYWKGPVPLISDSAIAVMSYGQFLDGRVAEQELGYAPTVSIEEAIRRTFRWLCEQGLIAGRNSTV